MTDIDKKRLRALAGDATQGERLEHERDLLAVALGECIQAAGIIRPDAALTGPQLLMFAEDLKRLLTQPPALDGEPEVMAFLHSSDGYMSERWVDLRRDNACNPRALVLQDHHRAHATRLQTELAAANADKAAYAQNAIDLQAEVERLGAELEATGKLYEEGCQATYDFDAMQQEINDLRGMLRMAWGSDDISAEDCRRIDAALNKTEGQS